MTTTEETKAIERTLPANIQAEQMLLGSLLINSDLLNQVSEFLQSQHFHEPLHQKIYDGIEVVCEKGISATPITMLSMLSRDPMFIEAGSQEYLHKLTTMAMVVINPVDYGNIIYDLALKRSLISIGEEVVNHAYDSTLKEGAASQLEEAEMKLFNLAISGNNERSFVSMKDSVIDSMQTIDKAIKNSDKIVGTTSGLEDLDRKLAGFQDSDLVILAGRPSMGKTAFLINFAFNAAKSYLKKTSEDGAPLKSVGVFSLEMSAGQLVQRMMSMETKIDSSNLRTGRVNEEHYNKLKKAAIDLGEMQLFIDDTPALTISAIRTRARRLKRKHNLGILFIDYLQLIHGNGKSDNRVLEISQITQALKAIAKELNIPVIALSQLSRAVEQRDNKRPMLSDLRESGSIEQDADIVMFVYREEYYLLRQQPKVGDAKHDAWMKDLDDVHNIAELIIAKHRNGAIGTVKVFYVDQFSNVTNLQKQN